MDTREFGDRVKPPMPAPSGGQQHGLDHAAPSLTEQEDPAYEMPDMPSFLRRDRRKVIEI